MRIAQQNFPSFPVTQPTPRINQQGLNRFLGMLGNRGFMQNPLFPQFQQQFQPQVMPPMPVRPQLPPGFQPPPGFTMPPRIQPPMADLIERRPIPQPMPMPPGIQPPMAQPMPMPQPVPPLSYVPPTSVAPLPSPQISESMLQDYFMKRAVPNTVGMTMPGQQPIFGGGMLGTNMSAGMSTFNQVNPMGGFSSPMGMGLLG